jgi:hypothetical protein
MGRMFAVAYFLGQEPFPQPLHLRGARRSAARGKLQIPRFARDDKSVKWQPVSFALAASVRQFDDGAIVV